MVATVFTTTGARWDADKFIDLATASGPSTATDWFIGWGTGGSSTGGTATAGDLDLKAAATEARVSATVTQPAATTDRFVATITAGTAKTVEESGLFKATASGIMVARGSHVGVALATGDAIQYTWELSWS